MGNNSIWKKIHIHDMDEKLYEDVDNFFESIHGSRELEYREGQHTMALDIVDAMNEKQILLVEAQVGIGKSYAYLIPLITKVKNDENFKGFIVATSTIALQEQLLKDVEKVSELLGVENLDVVLAKGKNNYLCQRRLHEFLKSKEGKEYQEILNKMDTKTMVDRKDFEAVPNAIWNRINVTNCQVHSCPYYASCKFVVKREDYSSKKKVIITNQDLLAQDLKADNDSKIFSEKDMIVVDEAHSLEDKIRNAYQKTLDKRKIEGSMYHLYNSVSNIDESLVPSEDFINNLNEFFSRIRFSAKKIIQNSNAGMIEYNNCEKVPFICNDKIKDSIGKLIRSIDESILAVERKEHENGVSTINKRALETINQFKTILKDLQKGKNGENIYWADFLDRNGKYVQLSFAPRNMKNITTQLLENSKSGFVLTSATLSTGKGYEYYADSMGLNNVMGKPILKEFPIESPYNYEENTLLYSPKDMEPPNGNHALYIEQITEYIKELIDLTKGRSLVLFTSKKDMKEVYERLQSEYLDYPLYIQQEGVNNQKLKTKFEENISSCLLATGSFFEGIDIKGESLSSVIIPRLPFPIVDVVTEEKARVYQDGFKEVYLPEMILKLKQGAGRLIRSSNDKGIVSILDSRFWNLEEKYDSIITNSLPYKNITSDLDEVKNFVQEKLR